ncbi:MAG TPA: MFS transporter [Methylomirabilota bacterium]|nr:MFS transporter [Methylomirabilota bacterium]
MSGRPPDGTALLCLLVFCNTVCIGTFSPLLPEIGRTQALADWQLGILAGAFGFARMIADVPAGALAGPRLGATLVFSPVILLAGLVLLSTAGPFPVLVLGRILTGIGHTFAMVGGLTAVLQDDRGPSRSVRLNLFEFAGMLGVMGGLAVVGVLPTGWGWPVSLLLASTPALVSLVLGPSLRRRFPDRGDRAVPPPAAAHSRSPSATAPIVWLMFGAGAVMSLAWSAVSQFVLPLRGTREFGLDRGGVSMLLALAQMADLLALLPVGWLADRMGRVPVLGAVLVLLGLGTLGTAGGSLGLFIVGCALFGLGMAGWMLPLGVIREHTDLGTLAWRTGLYRVGLDATSFLGPLICGFLGEAHTGMFIALVGLATVAAGARLLWRAV